MTPVSATQARAGSVVTSTTSQGGGGAHYYDDASIRYDDPNVSYDSYLLGGGGIDVAVTENGNGNATVSHGV